MNWPLWLMLGWLGGSLALLGQMLLAYFGMARQRAHAAPFYTGDAAGRALGEMPQVVLALQAARGSMPMTFGVMHPVVFLPADAAEWSEERRSLVMRHELAHIERGDAASHLVARCALSLLWWHPLAWKSWREFLKERERAADDLVLSGGVRASDYAGLLLDIARSMQSRNAAAWAGVAMARRSQLEGRLVAILDARVSRKATRRASALAATAAAVALCAPIAAVRAQDPQTAQTQTALPADVEVTMRVAYAQKNPEIVDKAAAAFIGNKNYAVAEKLLDAGLKIRASNAGEKSKEYAAGLVKLGDLDVKRGRIESAEAYYRMAVSLGDSPEVEPALMFLGMSRRSRPSVPSDALQQPTSLDYFQRALAVAPNLQEQGRAMTWLALAESQDPAMLSQAETHFRTAISQQDANSQGEANSLDLFARFLEGHDRAGEAKELRERSSAIVKAQISEESEVSSRVAYPNVSRASSGPAGVTAPHLMSKVEPEYTEEARAAKYQGVVVLQVVIGPDGRAHNFKVARSLGLGLDQKAVEAVQKWVFQPGTKDGNPVPIAATIEVNFQLL